MTISYRNKNEIESKELPQTPNEILNIICKFAKEKNKDALSNLISEGICINIFYKEETPSQRLGLEKEVEALIFLISEFRASIDEAVLGLAINGHFDVVDDFVRRGASIQSALLGATISGYFTHAEDFIRRGGELNNAAMGAERGGHIDQAEDFIRRGATLNWAARGTVSGGNFDRVKEFIRRGADLSWITSTAAKWGYFDQVEDFICQGASLKSAAQGAISGGYFAQGEDFIRRGVSLDDAAASAIQGGHLNQAKKFIRQGADLNNGVYLAAKFNQFTIVEDLIRQGASLDFAVEGAVQSGRIAKVEDLIHRGADLKKAVLSSKKYLVNKELALHLLSSFKDPKLINDFAKEVDKSIKSTPFKMCSLLPQAIKIQKEILEKQFSFNHSKIWQVPEIQGWFAFCFSQGQLPDSLNFLVATYLCSLSHDSVKNLFNTMQFEIRKINLIIDLQKYYLSTNLVSFFRDKRPEKFKKQICEAKSNKDFEKLLSEEICSLSEKDNYHTLLITGRW